MGIFMGELLVSGRVYTLEVYEAGANNKNKTSMFHQLLKCKVGPGSTYKWGFSPYKWRKNKMGFTEVNKNPYKYRSSI